MKLVVNVEILVEILLAEHVEKSSVDQLAFKHRAVLRQTETAQPVVGHPALVQLRRVRILSKVETRHRSISDIEEKRRDLPWHNAILPN